MNKTTPDIDQLITCLRDELEPVAPLSSPAVRAMQWFFGGLIAIIIVGALVSYRPDLDTKITELSFIGEIALILMIAGSAAYASAWLSLPDGGWHKQVVILPYILIMVAMIIAAREMLIHGFQVPVFDLKECIIDATFMGIIPIGMIIWMMRSGAPTYPALAVSVNMIAAGSMGYLGLRLSCGSDEIGHICVYHVMPFVVVGLALGLVARRLYRW